MALVILAVLLAAAFPYITSRPMDLRADTNDLVANLRLARDWAISRTRHYRVRVVSPTRYVLEEGSCNQTPCEEDDWSFQVVRHVDLRPNVRFGGTGTAVRFNSQGRALLSDSPTDVVLEDTARQETRTVRVWATGGVEER